MLNFISPLSLLHTANLWEKELNQREQKDKAQELNNRVKIKFEYDK